jgi:hypothetical protein
VKYLIKHNYATDVNGYPLYWSNDSGYGDLMSATFFDLEYKRSVSLPSNGHWVEVKTPEDQKEIK